MLRRQRDILGVVSVHIFAVEVILEQNAKQFEFLHDIKTEYCKVINIHVLEVGVVPCLAPGGNAFLVYSP